MVQTPVLIDTDPGTDDAVALLLAAALHMPVRGVLSSYGNLPLKQTHANAAALLRALDIQCRRSQPECRRNPRNERIGRRGFFHFFAGKGLQCIYAGTASGDISAMGLYCSGAVDKSGAVAA